MTWYEPTPIKTTSDQNEALPPGSVQIHEGSSATLNWSYSLTLGLGLGGFVKFNGDSIVAINSDGSAGRVSNNFQERFSFSSTLGNASLSISPVTVADDKANGEFWCELFDSKSNIWKRAIQLEVIGKLESIADCKKGIPKLYYTVIQVFPRGLV